MGIVLLDPILFDPGDLTGFLICENACENVLPVVSEKAL